MAVKVWDVAVVKKATRSGVVSDFFSTVNGKYAYRPWYMISEDLSPVLRQMSASWLWSEVEPGGASCSPQVTPLASLSSRHDGQRTPAEVAGHLANNGQATRQYNTPTSASASHEPSLNTNHSFQSLFTFLPSYRAHWLFSHCPT